MIAYDRVHYKIRQLCGTARHLIYMGLTRSFHCSQITIFGDPHIVVTTESNLI